MYFCKNKYYNRKKVVKLFKEKTYNVYMIIYSFGCTTIDNK